MWINDLIEEELFKSFNSQFDKIFIHGLALKGFFFNNKPEAEEFAKEACRCEDFTETQEKVFYVNDIPFLIYNYKIEDFEFTNDLENISITASYGSYAYL